MLSGCESEIMQHDMANRDICEAETFRFVSKPWDNDELIMLVEKLLKKGDK
jgi:hypothetical protein